MRLCAASGQAAYSPALGETSTHPANEARLQGVRLVLDHLGAQAQGAAIQVLWDSYVALSQQSRPPDYETCYPHALLGSLAGRVVDACRNAGLRAFGESAGAPGTEPDLPLLIGTAWEQFLALGDGYQDWERHQLAELWASLGFASP